ncbi:hypothetical protein Q9L58_007560 [Maublancomyces gigas]|uniref:Major facilitator superfamily (MFS) profile domain-containing protein n=1 Tax=Discina gigas TaxID=1032678 RepID=A0ABR3GCE1_9PEZI
MGFWILEPSAGGHVPGTSFMGAGSKGPTGLTGSSADTYSSGDSLDPNLKYDTTGPAPIVLIPQPSDDPNDPLNWSLRQRDCITAILCFVSVLASCLTSVLASNTIILVVEFEHSLTETALLTGYHLCSIGVTGIITVATARVWGKRHLYVFGTVLLIVSSFWAGAAKDYNSLLWARILQGVAVCPFEALVNTSVGDLYCVHQRGKRMALTNFSLFGGAFITPVVVGKITSTLGWRWSFYFVGIFSGLLLPLVILFVPETAFRRSSHYNSDIVASTSQIFSGSSSPTHPSTNPDFPVDLVQAREKDEHQEYAPALRDGWVKRMALFNGRKSEDSLWKLVLRPIALLVHPAVFWGVVTQGALIGWTVMIGVVLAFIFVGYPTLFTEVEVGYMYIGAFLGATAGFLLVGPVSDWSARWLTRRNNGIFEPEFRLFLIIPQALTGVLGLYLFGWTSANTLKYGWALPDFFFGLEVMGTIIGAVASSLYIVDAHRDIAVEAFTSLLLFKNFFSYALTTKAFDWILEQGVWRTFWIIGTVQVGVCLLTIPMYIFGKRNRALMQRYDILKMTRLDCKVTKRGGSTFIENVAAI